MISAVVIAKNEENRLRECLLSLKWCDEVIVIDNNSDDKTVGVAKRAGAKVFSYEEEGDFAAIRNFGLSKATQDWVLFVDADEIVTKELADEMYQNIAQFLVSVNGFYVTRQDSLWGKELNFGDMEKNKFLRLARKDKGKWQGKVHETWEVLGEKRTLKNPLLHYPHQSVAEFLSEINYYSTLRAQELYDKGVKAHWWSIILYSKGKFFYNYFYKQGFRDGLEGMIHALLMSFYSFLVRGKLWHMRDAK